MQSLIQTWKIDVTHAVIRIVPATMGLLCIPAAFLLGRQVSGRLGGCLLAVTFALHPFLIQINREAYFYSQIVLGVTLLTFGVMRAVGLGERDRTLDIYTLLALCAGYALMTQGTFTAWALAAAEAAFLALVLLYQWAKTKSLSAQKAFLPIGLMGVITLPMFFTPWGLGHMLGKFGSENRARGDVVFSYFR